MKKEILKLSAKTAMCFTPAFMLLHLSGFSMLHSLALSFLFAVSCMLSLFNDDFKKESLKLFIEKFEAEIKLQKSKMEAVVKEFSLLSHQNDLFKGSINNIRKDIFISKNPFLYNIGDVVEFEKSIHCCYEPDIVMKLKGTIISRDVNLCKNAKEYCIISANCQDKYTVLESKIKPVSQAQNAQTDPS